MYKKIVKDMKSDINIINAVVNDVISQVSDDLDKDCLFSIKLIISELIINSIKHGNKFDINKNIHICFEISDDFIEICVSDEGLGIELDDKTVVDKELSENGRGLVLVKGLSDEFRIDNNNVKCIIYNN